MLFPAMEAAGVPTQGGPVGVMLNEHVEGRRLTAGLRAAAEKLDAGDASAAGEVRQYATGYADLLKQHILKEDQILFPMADNVISGAALDSLREEFDRDLGSETARAEQERFTALVEKLEEEIGA